jgi:hypothetical protein
VEAGMQRAAVTFAAARGLNALLSLAQSAQLSVGVASANPAAVLEPIDDLVEQFSALMLWATVSFGVQRVLLTASASWPIALLLTTCLAAGAVLYLRRREVPAWLLRAVVVLAILRLAVPVLAVVSEGTYQWLLRDQYEQTQAKVEQTAEESRPKSSGWWEKWKEKWSAAQYEELKAKAEGAVNDLILLATVFVIQVILLPLAFLWLMVALVRRCLKQAGDREWLVDTSSIRRS